MIDKLEMLIALARERHFGRAAEACHVTQPTLSSAIKTLEESLGVQLVVRGARFVGLTPEGDRVLARAKAIVAESRAMKTDVAIAREGLTGTLRIGVIPTALTAVHEYTRPFLSQNPGVRLRILSLTSNEILERLSEFDLDAGLSYAEADLQADRLTGFQTVALYDESYALVTHAGQARETAAWADLATLPLGLLTPDMQNRRILDRHLARAGVTVAPRLESNSTVALVSHVEDGTVATVLPMHAASYFAERRGLACTPLPQIETGATRVAFILPPVGRRTLLLDAFVQSLA